MLLLCYALCTGDSSGIKLTNTCFDSACSHVYHIKHMCTSTGSTAVHYGYAYFSLFSLSDLQAT